MNTVYHAAAYKHVSIVEENPFEAVRNNIYGTKICAESAIKCNVDTFVLISTDKAVRPTNIMGATKDLLELILQSLNNYKHKIDYGAVWKCNRFIWFSHTPFSETNT